MESPQRASSAPLLPPTLARRHSPPPCPAVKYYNPVSCLCAVRCSRDEYRQVGAERWWAEGGRCVGRCMAVAGDKVACCAKDRPQYGQQAGGHRVEPRVHRPSPPAPARRSGRRCACSPRSSTAWCACASCTSRARWRPASAPRAPATRPRSRGDACRPHTRGWRERRRHASMRWQCDPACMGTLHALSAQGSLVFVSCRRTGASWQAGSGGRER
mgnify:CR=1 FL=1